MYGERGKGRGETVLIDDNKPIRSGYPAVRGRWMKEEVNHTMRHHLILRFLWRVGYRVCYFAAAFLMAAFVFLIFIMKPGINIYARAMFGDMVHGEAYKPFVYRTLLPSLTGFLAGLVPTGTRTAIESIPIRILNWEPELLTEYLIASLLMFLSLVGFFIALKYLFRGIFQAPDWFLDIVSLAALVGLPPCLNIAAISMTSRLSSCSLWVWG
jgi:hypothetical protein